MREEIEQLKGDLSQMDVSVRKTLVMFKDRLSSTHEAIQSAVLQREEHHLTTIRFDQLINIIAANITSCRHMEDMIANLKDQLSMETARRRELQSEISSLRGNIRVLARIRPLLPRDNGSGDVVVRSDGGENVVVDVPGKGRKTYTFDGVCCR